MGKYYFEDTPERQQYFVNQFFKLAKVSKIDLSQITSLEKFEAALQAAFAADKSLLSYFEGMTKSDIQLFYSHPDIQEIVRANKENAGLGGLPFEPPKPPKKIVEIKWVKTYRRGKITRGRRTFIKIKGKRKLRYRDIRGRFVSLKK